MTTFKNFTLGSLFEINNGRRVTKDKQIKGKTPYVTAVTTNNGVDTYIGNPPFIENNILTVNFFGNTYYHPYDVSYKDGTYGLKLLNKSYRTKGIYLYLLTVIEKTTLNMGSYSKMLTGNIMFDTEVKLPVKSLTDTEPDWEYMENYILEIEKKAILSVKEKNEKDIELLKGLVGHEKGSDILETVEYKEFSIGEVFDIGTGNLIAKDLLVKGTTPRVSAQTTNNGILGYYKDLDSDNYRTFDNCVSISFLGDSFYHDYKASFDMKIHTLKHKNMNKYVGKYLVSLLDKSCKPRFSYGNQLSSSKLKKEKIMLPVTKQSTESVPDWKTIESYMKHIQQKYILLKEQQNEEELANLFKFTGLNEALLLSGNEQDCLAILLQHVIAWDYINFKMANIELSLKQTLQSKLSELY